MSMGPGTAGRTEELARDSAAVTVGPDQWLPWLRPRSEVTLAIELPSSHGRVPRWLKCEAVVIRVGTVNGHVRVELEITSMAFAAREG